MILKLVQLVVACAIFNPFCCCTAVVLDLDDAAGAPAAHGCCQSQSSELPADSDPNSGHDLAECPHAALKDYEIANHKDLNAPNDHGMLLPALLAVCDLLAVEPANQAHFPVSVSTVSHAPPRSFAQVYCIYRV